jgi:hypothetical protein
MTEVPDVIDPDKTGSEEADPHVIALALFLADEEYAPAVVSEERRDRPDKISIATACGILGISCMPLRAFLRRHGIWPLNESKG